MSVALRDELVEQLKLTGRIRTAAVEAAVRRVARERFLPAGTDPEIAYALDDAVVMKRDAGGTAISSVSGAGIQAQMLEQAGLRPGMDVLEIGSGGLNAAMIAEIGTRVVSVDIDPDVTARAEQLLAANGYRDRVTVHTADAGQAIPGEGPFDAIIVTVGAWDIAPGWWEQLRPGGTLVLPLVMNGATRSIGFRKTENHLVSTSMEVAGFVSMQGAGRHDGRIVVLPHSDGTDLKLLFDSGAPDDPHALDDILAGPRCESWSGVTIRHGVPFPDLQLWLAWFLPGFCMIAVDARCALASEAGTWFPFGVVHGAGFAHLAVRPALDGAGIEFGARGYGATGPVVAGALVEQVGAWDRTARGTEPSFAYWPTPTVPAAADATLHKPHGIVTITWP
ncbi:methyltransferase, FxLD system [Actinoplanes sp. NPDC026619]|uniref:methyltransferase, FxLD system n=1 Tax=Actinoplanes sp. NPDC026619 TaxID=3155798 RepID=UPI0034118429